MNMINNYSILEAYRSANLIFEDDDSDKTKVAHDINTPDKPESNYAQVTFISIAKDIDSISKNLDSNSGKALLFMFEKGPSTSILSNGEITVEPVADFPKDSPDSDSENKPSDKSNSDKSNSSDNSSNNSSDNSSGNNSDSSTNSKPSSNIPLIRQGRSLSRQASSASSVNSSLVRNNYSILNAYNTIHQINEEDTAETNNANEPDKISVGSFLRVRVKLNEEGYTDWHIALDTAVSSDDLLLQTVISLLKRGDFKTALATANKAVKSPHLGLAPVALQSFLYEERKCGIPWMGHCNYAILAGSEDSNVAFYDIISLCVIPESIQPGKQPNKEMAFLARFQIKDKSAVSGNAITLLRDILGSAIDWFIGDKQIADRINTDKSEDPSVNISEFIKNRKFKGEWAGDSKKYGSFCKIRDWLIKNSCSKGSSDTSKAFIYLDGSINGRPVSDTVKDYSQQHSKDKRFAIYF